MTTLTVVRAGLFALTIVALGFAPGVSVADPPSATDHPGALPLLTGHGDFRVDVDGNLRTFSFSVIKQPNGNVVGQAEIHNRVTDTVVHMDIDCVHFVSTNMVRVSGTIKKSNRSTMVGLIGVFLAQGNGEGTNGPPDGLSFLQSVYPFQGVNCHTAIPLAMFPVEHGNIHVRPEE